MAGGWSEFGSASNALVPEGSQPRDSPGAMGHVKQGICYPAAAAQDFDQRELLAAVGCMADIAVCKLVFGIFALRGVPRDRPAAP
jgi:hypothetical protein